MAEEQVQEHGDEPILSNWEFQGKVPTTADLIRLLGGLPPLYGVDWVEIADYVQGMPSQKKVQQRDDQGRKITGYVDVYRLYVAVAGRLHQAMRAADVNDWRIDFVPEPVTPTGVPGFLQMDDRLVYREYMEVYERTDQTPDGWRMVGRRPGMAWVPASGGSSAAGTNPYEKVETAARGRALGAWGFGVLPGSGIASLEEMQSQTVAAPPQESNDGPRQQRLSRADMEEQAMTLVEEVRLARGKTQEQMFTEVSTFGQRTFGKSLAGETDDTGAVLSLSLAALKDGQVQLLINGLQKSLQAARSEESAL